MPLFIKFVLMCFFLLAAGYFITSSGSIHHKLISKHWRVVTLKQIPNPFESLPKDLTEEEIRLAKNNFEKQVQHSYINFLKQGNYESRLLSDQNHYGIWSINKDATELTLEYNGSKEALIINELTSTKMILTRKRVSEEMTVLLIPS
jgi:hypothetical protein